MCIRDSFMMQFLPGDPFTGEKQLPAAQMEALYAKYGLDKPVWQQFFIYIGNVVQGDLGVSLTYNLSLIHISSGKRMQK